MKSKNAKSGKKTKKVLRKAARKELRDILVTRMMEVIRGLGHSGEGLQKTVRKATRKLSRKLEVVLEDRPAEKKLPGKIAEEKASSRELKPVARKELVKARKVVARAGAGSNKSLSTGVLTTSVSGPDTAGPVSGPGADPIAEAPVAPLKKEWPDPGEDPVSPS